MKNYTIAYHYQKPDLIYNMYDFIDQTNPGRLKVENKKFIFR